MRTLTAVLLAILMVSVVACEGGETTLTTLDEVMEETVDDLSAAIEVARDDMANLGQQIEQSEPSQDLQAAWEDFQANLSEFFTDLQSEDTLDTSRVEEAMDEFERRLDEAGDAIGPEVRAAWESLRVFIEGLIDNA